MEDEKYSEMEIDLEEWTKKDLINFIIFAHNNNYTFNEAIVHSLESIIDSYEKEKWNSSNFPFTNFRFGKPVTSPSK